jgi:hypothetical protein
MVNDGKTDVDDLIQPGVRKLTADDVEFEETAEPEASQLREAQPSGDPSTDAVLRRVEREIGYRLFKGDTTAWCVLVVKVAWRGFTGYAALGRFSFPEGNTGPENSEYARAEYALLREQALADLNKSIAESLALVEAIRQELSVFEEQATVATTKAQTRLDAALQAVGQAQRSKQ